MVSEQHGRDPFVRAPSPCRTGSLSPDRLLPYFIRTTFAACQWYEKAFRATISFRPLQRRDGYSFQEGRSRNLEAHGLWKFVGPSIKEAKLPTPLVADLAFGLFTSSR